MRRRCRRWWRRCLEAEERRLWHEQIFSRFGHDGNGRKALGNMLAGTGQEKPGKGIGRTGKVGEL